MAVTRHDSRYRLPVRPVRSLSDNPYELQELIENPDETDDLLRLGLHRLPIREFPLLRSLAPALASYDGATELERGLDILLTGLTDSLTPSAVAQPGPGPAADDLQRKR